MGTNGTPFAYRITTDPTVRISTMPSLYPAALFSAPLREESRAHRWKMGSHRSADWAADRGRPKRTVTQGLTLTILLGPGGPTPPTILTDPLNRTAQMAAPLDSSLPLGSGPLRYTWRLNGTPLAGATNSILALTGVSTNQAGEYSVVVTNGFGSATSASATLTVVVRPFIATQPVAQTVVAGTEATFSVAAGGTAPLTYQWRLNRANLPAAPTRRCTSQMLPASRRALTPLSSAILSAPSRVLQPGAERSAGPRHTSLADHRGRRERDASDG